MEKRELTNDVTMEMLAIVDEIDEHARRVREDADDGPEANRLEEWTNRMRQLLAAEGKGKRRKERA